jgi:hypothetical protein
MMKLEERSMRSTLAVAIAAAVFLTANGAAFADPDKDESGHGRRYGRGEAREYKEEFRDGNCKIERKWEKNGDYKEEVKCKGNGAHHAWSMRVRRSAAGSIRAAHPFSCRVAAAFIATGN